jgi:5-methylcytosine-specific restriction endonuclease McrA
MRRPNLYGAWLYRHNRLVVLADAMGQCYVAGCRRPATTADHIVPLSAGGSHALTNLRACCPHHNSVGGAHIANERRRVGRRSRSW